MTATITTHTFDAPGATIAYDVRGTLGEGVPLLLIGSPKFATLGGHFTDRPVITYDPRGTARSRRTDGHGEITPARHAGDLQRLVEAIEDMYQTYQRDGMGPAMATFMLLVSHDGELPGGYRWTTRSSACRPTTAAGATTPFLGQNLRSCTGYQPDTDALRAATTRIVIARGEASGQTMAARGADAIAAAIGPSRSPFPGDHGGFLGGEYGMRGEPDAFAQRLCEVLDGA